MRQEQIRKTPRRRCTRAEPVALEVTTADGPDTAEVDELLERIDAMLRAA